MHKKIIELVVVVFSLAGCSFNLFNNNKNNEPEIENTVDDNKETKKDKIGEFFGGFVEGTKYSGYEFSKSEEDIIKPNSGIGELNIYAFNDFHGAVNETDNESGLKKMATFYKEKSQQENTLILDQGDTWQGSLESNNGYGALVQDVFNYAGVSLRTVGNHDFDWGQDKLIETSNRKIGDDYIPSLAANIYDYNNGVIGKNQQSQFGKEYATFCMDNGLKVGVVGVIGEDQITTICSQLVSNVAFTNQVEKIKEISDFLRVEKDCDIVIASAHEYASKMINDGLTDVSSVSGKRYVDLVLNGHAHERSSTIENRVNFVQWDANGGSSGYINLKYDFESGTVLDKQTTTNSFYPNYLKTYYSTINPTINKMVDEYLVSVETIGKEVLSQNFINREFDSGALANLMTEAIYKKCAKENINVDFAVCNYARSSFIGTMFTYGDLYKCFPFDNEIIIMDVSGYASFNSIKHNFSYREDTSKKLNSYNTFRIAVVDYIGLHQDSSRNYDYFPNCNIVKILKNNSNEMYTYRNALYDHLKDNQNKTFNSSDYSSTNSNFRVD